MLKSIVASLLFAAGMASASATTINFDALEQAGTGFQNMNLYVEGDFFLSASIDFGSAQQQNTNWYLNSASLFNDAGDGWTVLHKWDESVFSLNSIDLAPVSATYPGGASVRFVGYLGGVPMAEQTFEVGQAFAFTTFHFTGFSNVDSVIWYQDYPYHQFDNIVLNAVDVPEPGSLALLGFGLAGLAAARRKRVAA